MEAAAISLKSGVSELFRFWNLRGVKELDYVFISHGDADHMSGIEEILQNQTLEYESKSVLPPVRLHDDALKKLGKTAKENGTKVFEWRQVSR